MITLIAYSILMLLYIAPASIVKSLALSKTCWLYCLRRSGRMVIAFVAFPALILDDIV